MRKFLILISVLLLVFCCSKKKDTLDNSWIKVPGYPSQSPYSMFFLRDTLVVADDFFAGSFYTSADNGRRWSETNTSFDGTVTPFFSYQNRIYAGQTNGAYYSDNMCKSWVIKNNGLPTDFNMINLVGTDIGLFACGYGLYNSNDLGDTWTKVETPDFVQISTIAYIENALIVYAIKAEASTSGIYKSEDNGQSWTYINSASGISESYVNKFIVSNNRLYAVGALPGAVYVSNDKGSTWIKSAGLNANGINYINTIISSNASLYAGSTQGVFKSDDYGINWVYIGCYNVLSLALKDHVLYAGTISQGLWAALLKD